MTSEAWSASGCICRRVFHICSATKHRDCRAGTAPCGCNTPSRVFFKYHGRRVVVTFNNCTAHGAVGDSKSSMHGLITEASSLFYIMRHVRMQPQTCNDGSIYRDESRWKPRHWCTIKLRGAPIDYGTSPGHANLRRFSCATYSTLRFLSHQTGQHPISNDVVGQYHTRIVTHNVRKVKPVNA